MRIAYITAGAAGMFCGSCLHDNTLAAALLALGHDAVLVPTYTPILTDEKDVSLHRVFFSGINVYLQQKFSLFRHTPWSLDRLFAVPALLRWVAGFGMEIEAHKLGALTVSMLKGEHGNQRKEVEKLAAWLAENLRPQVVNLTNVLLSGLVHEVKRRLPGVPVLGTLQGDDVFLEGLTEPYRSQALGLIRDHCREMDGFIATSAYYADFMAEYLAIPRDRIHVILPGLNLAGHGGERPPRAGPPVVGYFARICPEKGLHVLAEAFRLLRQTPGAPACRLRVSGWLGEGGRRYYDEIERKLKEAGLGADFERVESPDHNSKVRFFQGIDVLSVPTTYREPKGLYVLEALANGVPVVQPGHGSFPELIEATGGGLLVRPDDPADLARGLRQLLENDAHRAELGRKGKEAVWRHFHAERMARATAQVYGQYTAARAAAAS
ncbi:MAG TPA: glycosyltransferase family 4 protein [Gemmataceae bacterium]|nr:glycosyltransferase family 4 protein [Gemmataceae bacterium]